MNLMEIFVKFLYRVFPRTFSSIKYSFRYKNDETFYKSNI